MYYLCSSCDIPVNLWANHSQLFQLFANTQHNPGKGSSCVTKMPVSGPLLKKINDFILLQLRQLVYVHKNAIISFFYTTGSSSLSYSFSYEGHKFDLPAYL